MANPNGKTVLVTGSTDGVGRVVAKRLGEQGWRVLVHGRDRGRGERVVAEIKDAGGAADFLAADPLFPCRGTAAGRFGAAGHEAARSSHQQCRHRQRRVARDAADQRRRLRTALRRELSFRLSAHASAIAAGQDQYARAHRQRLVARATSDRLCRRDVDARLQRLARLVPEQACPDHVYDRSRP
jgi:NAD(P)-dependent dehydrogenase (short-subunit alcohol dehydrogenase family)